MQSDIYDVWAIEQQRGRDARDLQRIGDARRAAGRAPSGRASRWARLAPLAAWPKPPRRRPV